MSDFVHEDFLKSLMGSIYGPSRTKSEPGSAERESEQEAQAPKALPPRQRLAASCLKTINDHLGGLEPEHRAEFEDLAGQFQDIVNEGNAT